MLIRVPFHGSGAHIPKVDAPIAPVRLNTSQYAVGRSHCGTTLGRTEASAAGSGGGDLDSSQLLNGAIQVRLPGIEIPAGKPVRSIGPSTSRSGHDASHSRAPFWLRGAHVWASKALLQGLHPTAASQAVVALSEQKGFGDDPRHAPRTVARVS